jgi:hypothetical protein
MHAIIFFIFPRISSEQTRGKVRNRGDILASQVYCRFISGLVTTFIGLFGFILWVLIEIEKNLV